MPPNKAIACMRVLSQAKKHHNSVYNIVNAVVNSGHPFSVRQAGLTFLVINDVHDKHKYGQDDGNTPPIIPLITFLKYDCDDCTCRSTSKIR